MHYILTFLVGILVATFTWLFIDSHQSELVKHDYRLFEHHKAMEEALIHIHNDVANNEKVALDNSKKLDILLNIATNVSHFVDK